MQIEPILEKIGLTKNEVKVYLALIDIGQTTTSKIIKQTKINTSKVYESLDRLLNKGIVSYTIIKNKRHWIAENPERVKDYLEEEKNKIDKQEKLVNQILPTLNERRNLVETEAEYKVFEGLKGIKAAREKALKELKKGETFYLILSNFSSEQIKLNAYFTDFHRRRAKKGVKCRYVLNEQMKKIEVIRMKIPLTEYRILQTDALAPTWTEFYKDTVGIGVMGDNPSIILIKNKDVVKGFKSYFESLWAMGK